MKITEEVLQGRTVLWEFDCINSATSDGSPKELMQDLMLELLLQRSSKKDPRPGVLTLCLGRSCVLLCMPLLVPRMVMSKESPSGLLGTFDKVPVVFDAHLDKPALPTTKIQLVLLPEREDYDHT